MSAAASINGPVVDSVAMLKTMAWSKLSPNAARMMLTKVSDSANIMKNTQAIKAPFFWIRRVRRPSPLTELGCTSRSISRSPLR